MTPQSKQDPDEARDIRVADEVIARRKAIVPLIEWFHNEDRSLPIDEVGQAIEAYASQCDDLDRARKKIAKLRDALKFYGRVSSWIQSFAANDSVDLKEGDLMMVFLEGEDKPWLTAKEALEDTSDK